MSYKASSILNGFYRHALEMDLSTMTPLRAVIEGVAT